MNKNEANENNPVGIHSAADLANALLAAADKAANGKADEKQADVLCKCTDTLIRLTRFALEVRDDKKGSAVRWVTTDPGATSRMLAASPTDLGGLRKQSEEIVRKLEDPLTGPETTAHLSRKLAGLQSRIQELESAA